MGLINLDTITLSSGIQVSNAYISVATNPVDVTKNESNNFVLEFISTIWASETARDTGKNHIKQIPYFDVSVSNLSTSVYTIAYDRLKQVYPNHIDV